jgi:hypothetical protein
MIELTSDLSNLYIQNFPTVNDAISNLKNALAPKLLLEDISIINKFVGVKTSHRQDTIELYCEELYLSKVNDDDLMTRDVWTYDYRRLTIEEFIVLRELFVINYHTLISDYNQTKSITNFLDNDGYELI